MRTGTRTATAVPAGRPRGTGGTAAAGSRSWSWPAGAGAAVAVVTVLRLVVAGPGLDRVWAEDGLVFLWDARREGPASLGLVYAGYAHTLPRLWGLVGSQLPLEHYAAVTVLATALTAGVLGAFVFTAARRTTGSTGWALLAALALAAVPAWRGSVGSLANLQWLLLVATFWALVEPPGRRWAPVVLAAVASATTPLTVLLLPAALLVQRRRLFRSWAVAGLGAGLVVQVVLIASGRESADNPSGRSLEVPGNLVGTFVRGVAGPNVPAVDLGRFGELDIELLLGIAFVVAVALCLYGARSPRTAAVGALVSGALLYGGTSVLNGLATTRYAATAAMFVLAAVALLGPGLTTALRATVLAVVAANVLLGFPANDFRLSGPSWRGEVADHERSCAATGEPSPLELSPEGWGRVTLDCPR